LGRLYSQKFSKTHEWVKIDAGVGTVGITAHAAEALGEIVYVDLPKVGAKFKAGTAFGAVESVKAASDIYTPVSGEVVAINGSLKDAPDTINNSPASEGWMIKLKLDNIAEADSLMDSAAYEKHAAEDKH
jgi:glycine cleavage system H protein